MTTTQALIAQVRGTEHDHEFYPTTNEIITALVRAINRLGDRRYDTKLDSVLDIGAGCGKVLRAFKDQLKFGELYAIEKSIPLCKALPADVFIIGTEFHEQSLLAKQVAVTFCNPPYSEFESWAVKIIRESASRYVYLVIPTRWQDSEQIAAALAYREAQTKIIGEFTFAVSEDRPARAVVHLLQIALATESDDAFDRFFDEQFAGLKAKFDSVAVDVPHAPPEFTSLVVGPQYPDRLVELYNLELNHIRQNYDLVAKLDAALLKEFDVTPVRILGCLKARLAGLRNTYWKELFDHMQAVTDRLTAGKRRVLLEKLQRSGHVDFTPANIHAIILWVLKNANQYMDVQLIETFEKMVEQANVHNYASNRRVYEKQQWRYGEDKPTHVALEYRLVLQRCGGMNRDWRGLELCESTATFLGDLLTVARNLGFTCETTDPRLSYDGRRHWTGGKAAVFTAMIDGQRATLFEVRPFLNHNLHIRLHQQFALALNVEMGRLKGWLRTGAEAATELQEPEAAKFFQSNLQLNTRSLPMLAA